MIKILGFFFNLLVSMVFGMDIMNYYLFGGINIINNDVNRPFIIWLGFITCILTSVWFLQSHLNRKYDK
mgnify:FL=1